MGNSGRGLASASPQTRQSVASKGGQSSRGGGRRPSGMKGGQSSGTSRRGFASMDTAKQREIASKGGSASGGNFKNDPQRASEAGRIGGSR